MVKILHILKEQTPKKNLKNCCQKTEFKMAAKFKMATNTLSNFGDHLELSGHF
jgi:hypothetical protein